MPAARADIFRDRSLGPADKRALMRFLGAAADALRGAGPLQARRALRRPRSGLASPPEAGRLLLPRCWRGQGLSRSGGAVVVATPSCQEAHPMRPQHQARARAQGEFGSQPLVALLAAQGLSARLREFVLYALAMTDAEQETPGGAPLDASPTPADAAAGAAPPAREPNEGSFADSGGHGGPAGGDAASGGRAGGPGRAAPGSARPVSAAEAGNGAAAHAPAPARGSQGSGASSAGGGGGGAGDGGGVLSAAQGRDALALYLESAGRCAPDAPGPLILLSRCHRVRDATERQAGQEHQCCLACSHVPGPSARQHGFWCGDGSARWPGPCTWSLAV